MKKKISFTNVMFLIAGLLFCARITNFLTINLIEGQSMIPTYHEGEIVIGSNFDKLTNNLDYLDVVTAESPSGTPVIKRIIGMPGDTIGVDSLGRVYRNGEMLSEDYINEPISSEETSEYSTITLGDSEYFICGDNRNHSLDSRSYGPVTIEQIKSKVLFRLIKKGS